MIWPSKLILDWQSIALIALAVVLGAGKHLAEFVNEVKRLKVGGAEIELRDKVDKFVQEVNEIKEGAQSPQSKDENKGPAKTNDSATIDFSDKVSPDHRPIPFQSDSADVIDRAFDLASKNRELAINYIALELERAILKKWNRSHQEPILKRPTWSMVDDLVNERQVTEPIGDAIKRFWNIRNDITQPILPRNYMATELDRAIDSGIRLLRLLL
jgi:hypothetical protein